MAELHPELARRTAKSALSFAQAFDGTNWQSDEPWPHRIELGTALDHITELSAMVLNLATRVQGAHDAQRKLMAKLADLLDEDQFAHCENLVRAAGVEPPPVAGVEAPRTARIQQVPGGAAPTHEARRWCNGDGEWTNWQPVQPHMLAKRQSDPTFKVRPIVGVHSSREQP